MHPFPPNYSMSKVFLTAGLLALGVCALTQPGVNLDNFTFSDGSQCDLDGTAQSSAGKALNLLKNRYRPPKPSDFNTQVTMQALLKPGDDVNRFSPLQAAHLIGFVNDVKSGGRKETCNCGERKIDDRDTHIEISLSPDAPSTERVIVEVTPRLRFLMKQQGIDWRTGTLASHLQNKIEGKWIEIEGWLLFDTMHLNEAENTNPGNPQNWRATCWEVHPVTRMRVLPSPPALHFNTRSNTLNNLIAARRRFASELGPSLRAQLQRRNLQILSRFPIADREEDNASL